MNIKKIAVIGAGTMGGGIAETAARAGFEVLLEDVTGEAVRKGLEKIRERLTKKVAAGGLDDGEKGAVLSRIRIASNLRECSDADLVIEAVVEKEEVKSALFRELDGICSDRTLFSTNTSSIPVTRLARSLRKPGRFAGMHFMNPPPVMKLVEIIKGLHTTDETAGALIAVAERMGKKAVVVNDSPGFVISRVIITMINDAIYCLQEGVASRDGIDAIMKTGANYPMGPLELADLMGLDTCLEILDILHAELGEKYRACPVLRKMVDAGKLGRKSGEGFYEYR